MWPRTMLKEIDFVVESGIDQGLVFMAAWVVNMKCEGTSIRDILQIGSWVSLRCESP